MINKALNFQLIGMCLTIFTIPLTRQQQNHLAHNYKCKKVILSNLAIYKLDRDFFLLDEN